ncbi:MAG: hypothetical protein ACLRNW_01355 [Neglectibacter sp.]
MFTTINTQTPMFAMIALFPTSAPVGGQEKTKSKTWAPVGTLTKSKSLRQTLAIAELSVWSASFLVNDFEVIDPFFHQRDGLSHNRRNFFCIFPASYKRRARPMRRINFERFNSSVIFICETSLNSDFSIKHHAEYADKTKRLCCLHGLFIFFRAYSLLCRPKTAEQIPERGGRVNPGLLKLESPSHPDAVEHQRQHQFRAYHRNAHIPVDLLLPKLTVLKLLSRARSASLQASSSLRCLPSISRRSDFSSTSAWALISSIRACEAARSRIAFALSSFPDGRVRRFASSRLDHIIQQRFNLCHMLFLLSKIRIGSIIADVIRAYPAFDVSCGRRAVVLYS